MCLDSETLELHGEKILESLKLNFILVPVEDSKKVQLLMKSAALTLRKEFNLWDLNLQLWFCGKISILLWLLFIIKIIIILIFVRF